MAKTLPFDLVYQIAEYFVEPHHIRRSVPSIQSDFWNGFLTASGPIPLSQPEVGRYGYGTKFSFDGLYRETLPLRLVSRTWYMAVTRLLKLHQHWKVQLDSSALQRALKCIRHGGERNANNPIGLHNTVRSLGLVPPTILRTSTRTHDFSSADDNEGCMRSYTEYIYDGDRDKVYYDGTLNYHRKIHYDGRIHYDMSEAHALLRELFDSLESIECFQAGVPGARSECDNGYIHRAECYDMSGLDDLTKTLQYGLRSPAFINLVDLRLALPSTWHLAMLAEALPQTTRARLKHLGLKIVDATGPGGDRRYTICDREGAFPDGDLTAINQSGFPPSNVQYVYPDRDHADKLWSFIASCDSLETLGLEATHYLPLDQLKWSAGPGSKGLRNLLLQRVWTDVDSIIRLLRAPTTSDSPSALRKLVLNDVKMYENGGNWDKVFAHLVTQCPNLEFIDTNQLTYWSTHPHYAENYRIWENHRSIWTNGEEDEFALEKIYMHCVEKAGGKKYYPGDIAAWDTEDWL